MSIATELNRIIQAKSDIITSLTAKGATVPSGATIDDLPDIIDNLPSGGGGDTQTLIDLIERDITSINIPSGTTKIGYGAFSSCDSLTTVTIPEGVQSIGNYVFSSDTSLISVTIPSTVTSIGVGVFSNCSHRGLEIRIYATTPPTLGNNAFNGLYTTAKIYVPAGTRNDYMTATNWSNYSGKIIEMPSA